MKEELRSVETPHYHVWTDALHARELARNTKDRWNRGSYVRWTIIAACTALEIACANYLGRPVGRRFKDKVNKACDAMGVECPNWGEGVWQRVLNVRDWRHDSVHAALPQERLFAPVVEAEEAIIVVREAVLDMAARTGNPAPVWVSDDADMAEGSTAGASSRDSYNAVVRRAGATEGNPNTIRLCYVHNGKEYDSEYLAPNSEFDPVSALEDLAKSMRVPVSAWRAYRGDSLLVEIPLKMRGT